ncbi:SRPBCC family protein [Mycolicibacterium sp. CR10]|uniref:SRPBCC family protein n=1 Tax=Mycolicibacterium sp. CR10 TaxID=2562314 RepID=UPI0010C0C8EF|nr:SRPBCC family protein [Mycolicibacterium sp. CR10]
MNGNVVRVAGAITLLYAARRYYRNWGTTKEETQTTLPGDELVRRPSVQSTEGVWIDAPPAAIWPWLVQIGQDRGGLYSLDTVADLIGLDYENADRIHPEWQQLAPGDTIRIAPQGWMGLRHGLTLTVEQVIEESTLVLRGTPPGFPWETVWSFHLLPRWQDSCRFLIRTRTRLRHPGEVLGVELAGPVTSLVTRGLMLGIKRRVDEVRAPIDGPADMVLGGPL